MTTCRELEWTRAKAEPAPLDRVEPGTSSAFEGDATEDVDCRGAGVIITNVTPTIRAEDDDGKLTFGVVTVTGLTWRVPYTVAPDATQAMYAIDCVATIDDGRSLHFWYTLPVVPTTPLHA